MGAVIFHSKVDLPPQSVDSSGEGGKSLVTAAALLSARSTASWTVIENSIRTGVGLRSSACEARRSVFLAGVSVIEATTRDVYPVLA
jgi:hypothetical protein